MDELTPVTAAERALAIAQTPQETKEVEALAAAAKAWAKEQDNYEGVVSASRIHILARRKTTELIEPNITQFHGNRFVGGNIDVTSLSVYGFTKMQWSRRKKELEITNEEVDWYVDECIEKGIEPTVTGLLKWGTQIIPESTGNEWWTPKEYIDSVRAVLGGIDLDPASCAEANATVQASTFFTEEDNGLIQPWHGRVFINPPYSRNKDFAEKMMYEYENGNVDQAVILLGAHAIETKWFAPYWDHVLCFTGHRITFNTPNGRAKAGNIAGSVFIYLGDEQVKFADEFRKHGYVVKLWNL